MFWFIFAFTKGKVSKENMRPQAVWRSFAATMIYALSDEVHQVFVPGRGLDVIDLVMDAVGAGFIILGIVIWWRSDA